MKVIPFGERVAIKILQPEEITEGGLIMTTSKSESNRAIVVAVGEEVKDNINVEDKIIFSKGAGTNYTDGTEDYKIINIKDILCKLIEE